MILSIWQERTIRELIQSFIGSETGYPLCSFEDSVSLVQKCKELNCYAPIMIVEGMSWDPIGWPNTELGGLDPSIAKLPFLGYSVYKSKYESDSKDYIEKYCKETYNSISSNDLLCGFIAVEMACKAANAAGSTDTEAAAESNDRKCI